MPEIPSHTGPGSPELSAEPFGVDRSDGDSRQVTQDEIDDLINDTTMPIEERQARLEALSHQLGLHDTVDQGGSLDPLELQVAEALGLLAEGGHAYGIPESDPSDGSDPEKPYSSLDAGPSTR